MAVLAGDGLLTDAFAMAASAELPAEAVRYAVSLLAECAGSLGMVGGQALDIMSEERLLSEQEVLDIQTRKTGRLITAACTMGVVAGGGTTAQLEAAATFAGALGLAFQIRDDMLDVIGSKDEMGKSVGTDENKNTFVRLYGLDKCEELVQKYTQIAIDSLSCFDDNTAMTELARWLTDRRN